MSCCNFWGKEFVSGEIFLFRVPKRARQKILTRWLGDVEDFRGPEIMEKKYMYTKINVILIHIYPQINKCLFNNWIFILYQSTYSKQKFAWSDIFLSYCLWRHAKFRRRSALYIVSCRLASVHPVLQLLIGGPTTKLEPKSPYCWG